MRSFASDNHSGVLPEVMEALEKVNLDHSKAYGQDPWTELLKNQLREIFQADLEVFLVFNGTGANVLSLAGTLDSHHSVLCAQTSHLYCDESTAPESFTGNRIIPVETDDCGKILIEGLKKRLIRFGDRHFAQPKLLSLTQSTEYGTVYTKNELKIYREICTEYGLYFHLDGARFFQAAASLKCGLQEISSEIGVDVLSLGGTKVGMMYGEAVLVFRKELSDRFSFKHKQVMQLASKNRFIAAQFSAVLENDRWRKSAEHSNRMAKILAEGLRSHPGVSLTRPVEVNAVFAIMPPALYERLSQAFPFYQWNEQTGEVRLMCSFDTRESEILEFCALLSEGSF